MLLPCNNRRIAKSREVGLALISVMLVVALATLLATQLLGQTSRSLVQARHKFNDKQAYWYARSGEVLARQILHRDAEMDKQGSSPYDSIKDEWAQDFKVFNLLDGAGGGRASDDSNEEGELIVRVYDLNGHFNLNTLAAKGVERTAAKTILRNLLYELNLAESVFDKILDWVDANSEKRRYGAEDREYSLSDNRYLSANGPIALVSELRALDALSEADYQNLAQHLTVLPDTTTTINPNTATKKLMLALFGRDQASAAREMIKDRNRTPFTEQNDSRFQLIPQSSTTIDIRSEYFEIQVVAHYAQRRSYLRTLVQRSHEGEIQVLSRTHGQQATRRLLAELI